MAIPRWFLKNMGSLFLALVLALLVWAAAVNEADPLITQTFPGTLALEYTNIEQGYVLVGDLPDEGTMILRAPRSAWEQLSDSELRLVVDLAGLQEGTFELDVSPLIEADMVRVVSFDPESIEVTLERSLSRQMDVTVVFSGDPAIGFDVDAGASIARPSMATVTGPNSSVILVEELRALVDIAGRSGEMSVNANIVAVDAAGEPLADVTVSPPVATVRVTFIQQSGFRYVAVVPIIQGAPASGYWVRNITYSPTAVTLRSDDPQAVDLLAGYVETEPVDLTDARATIERTVLLSLPEGFTVIGDPRITLVVTIEALETSITITRALEIQGLDAGLVAQASPDTVRVFLQGPQPTLEALEQDDVVVVLDLTGFGPGTYQVEPQVLIVPSDVEVQAVLPESIEVTITELATPTP